MERKKNQGGSGKTDADTRMSAEEQGKIMRSLRTRSILIGFGIAACFAVAIVCIVLKFVIESEVRFHAFALLAFMLAAVLIVDLIFVRRETLRIQKSFSGDGQDEFSEIDGIDELTPEDAEELKKALQELKEVERTEMKKTLLSPKVLPFGIAYIVIVALLVLGVFFDWEWLGTAYRALFLLLYVIMGLHAFFVAELPAERIRAVVVFAAQAGLLLWLILFYNRYWEFVCVLVQTVLALYSIAVWLKYKARDIPSHGNMVILVGIAIIFLFVLFQQQTIQPADEMYMAWLIIPAVVITLFASIFIFFLFRDFFLAALKKTSELVASVFMILFMSYIVLWIGTVCGNAAFSPPPEIGAYVVLDKEFSSGRNSDSYELTVSIDGKALDIEVRKDEYNATEIGDVIEVGYFPGGFGLPYYQYIGPAQESPAAD